MTFNYFKSFDPSSKVIVVCGLGVVLPWPAMFFFYDGFETVKNCLGISLGSLFFCVIGLFLTRGYKNSSSFWEHLKNLDGMDIVSILGWGIGIPPWFAAAYIAETFDEVMTCAVISLTTLIFYGAGYWIVRYKEISEGKL